MTVGRPTAYSEVGVAHLTVNEHIIDIGPIIIIIILIIIWTFRAHFWHPPHLWKLNKFCTWVRSAATWNM